MSISTYFILFSILSPSPSSPTTLYLPLFFSNPLFTSIPIYFPLPNYPFQHLCSKTFLQLINTPMLHLHFSSYSLLSSIFLHHIHSPYRELYALDRYLILIFSPIPYLSSLFTYSLSSFLLSLFSTPLLIASACTPIRHPPSHLFFIVVSTNAHFQLHNIRIQFFNHCRVFTNIIFFILCRSSALKRMCL